MLAVVGAGLTVWSGVIHLQLWSEGYRHISVIGPLFLVQGIGSIVAALALVVFRRVFLLAAGAALMAGTGVGLLQPGHRRPRSAHQRPPGLDQRRRAGDGELFLTAPSFPGGSGGHRLTGRRAQAAPSPGAQSAATQTKKYRST